MSTRTITQVVCDGCGEANKEIVSTRVAVLSFGKVQMIETNEDSPLLREGRKRRDYCSDCVESDIYFCEKCNQPHQGECPIEVAKMDQAWQELEATGWRYGQDEPAF